MVKKIKKHFKNFMIKTTTTIAYVTSMFIACSLDSYVTLKQNVIAFSLLSLSTAYLVLVYIANKDRWL